MFKFKENVLLKNFYRKSKQEPNYIGAFVYNKVEANKFEPTYSLKIQVVNNIKDVKPFKISFPIVERGRLSHQQMFM